MQATLQSKLFASLFERLNDNSHITVLDLGPAVPETINFFSQYKCRLHFADLLAEPMPESGEEPITIEELREHFTEQLALPLGTKLDLCLFWDMLNYMDKKALQAFGLAIEPYLHEGTQTHGFGVINSRTQLANQRYGVESETTLITRANQTPQLDYYPHPQKEINEQLNCFSIGKGVLMTDGRLEILLKPEV